METKTEQQQEKALRERMRGEVDVRPEDTLPELRDDLRTVGLRDRMHDVPGVAPEDTRAELQDKQAQEEARQDLANYRASRETFKADEPARPEDVAGFHDMRFKVDEKPAYRATLEAEEPELVAAIDAYEQALSDRKQALKEQEFEAHVGQQKREAASWTEAEAKTRAEQDAEAVREERDDFERTYKLRDMERYAEASPHYQAALQAAAPDVAAELGKEEKVWRPRPAAQQAQADEASQSAQLDAQLADELRQRKAREQMQAMQGENSVDVQKTGKELESGEFIMPRRITQRYNEVDGKFFSKDARPLVMFVDKGDKLATSTTDRQAIEDMVALAKAKQWENLKLSGSSEFRREAWLQAESQGIKTLGYTPKQADLAALEALREERTKNTITPLQERQAERQQGNGKAAPRHDLNKNQAALHDAATKATTENLEALRKQPGFANRSDNDMQKLAYWRGIVSEDNKNQPQGVREEALARFDKAAQDPQFLGRLNQETRAEVEQVTTERVTERVQDRDTYERSL